MRSDDPSHSIIGAALHVHRRIGPGVLESVYEACLTYQLRRRGHHVDVQRPMPIVYDDVRIDVGFRIDLLVDEAVVVELKAVSHVLPIHEAQLLTYLRLSGCRIGLLLNFHEPRLKDGIRRMVNG